MLISFIGQPLKNMRFIFALVVFTFFSIASLTQSWSCEPDDEITSIEVKYKSGFIFRIEETIVPTSYVELLNTPPKKSSKQAWLVCGNKKFEFRITAATTSSSAKEIVTPYGISEVGEQVVGKYLLFNTKGIPSRDGSVIQNYRFCLAGSTISKKPKSRETNSPILSILPVVNYILDCKMDEFAVGLRIMRDARDSGLDDHCRMLARPHNNKEKHYVMATSFGAECDYDNPELALRIFTKLFQKLSVL